MPTVLPYRPSTDRHLSLPDTARFLILVGRVRLLDARMHRVVRRGAGFSDDRLLHLMRRWLALHERIAAMLPRILEPKHVREMRVILRLSDDARKRHVATRPQS